MIYLGCNETLLQEKLKAILSCLFKFWMQTHLGDNRPIKTPNFKSAHNVHLMEIYRENFINEAYL